MKSKDQTLLEEAYTKINTISLAAENKMTDDEINLAIAKVSGQNNDYCNDLNAMHEAEETLKGMDKAEFAVQLTKSAGKDWPDGKVAAGSFVHVHATARQRAEAFLKTIRK
jgi:hypothetical protein